ncbi:uncharacterized protein LTR77_006610 [Saxophila tyrrhenica]|uniref:14-3-3 domain-containing protein n=1 Tax=Saxophila tyrrhenica TaxID=1690608 RepID=A0AAV9P7B3_9PEZI|nr:hypothetical protein LTR77_006610 [Saxophila tyrrhenica]
MAVARIHEKILGRLARQAASTNVLLSNSIYQVLGLSILLQYSLGAARRQRQLGTTRDANSIKLDHHIIWLANEGLAITEVNILPYCQNGEQGPECRVMAAKLRADFYQIFCLYHNDPPVSQISPRSQNSGSSQTSAFSPPVPDGQNQRSPGTPSRTNGRSRKAGKAALRDPIPSMHSDTSYVTNPYAGLPSQTPPPKGPPPPIPSEPRRTPKRPPGLAPIDAPEYQTTAPFLAPPSNFVPDAISHFKTAQHLATTLLPPVHALRLSVALDYAVFLWDCAKDRHRSEKLARRAMKVVYASSEGLSDEEFEDAQILVRSLGGIVRRGTSESTPRPSQERLSNAGQPTSRKPQIDRTIAVSPPQQPNRNQSPVQARSIMRTPERLSTVPEVESFEGNGERTASAATSPPISRVSSRSRQRRGSSTASDKASKRRAAEQAEELHRKRSAGNRSAASGSSHSRQPTPQEGAMASAPVPVAMPSQPQRAAQPPSGRSKEGASAQERNIAILSALDIITSVTQAIGEIAFSEWHQQSLLRGFTLT